ncbi:MAG: hypothetical protein ACYTDX_08870 [Planctomycetota bacterium]|jgi:hypothetical protein
MRQGSFFAALVFVGLAFGAFLGTQRRSRTPAASEGDVETHGARQLRAMLRDRPAMNRLVRPGDELWTWAEERLNGRETGFLVYWDSEAPAGYAYSDHTWPWGDGLASIRIWDETPVERGTGERQWSSVVFELLNIESWLDFRDVHQEALRGRVALEDWIWRNTRIEHRAVIRTKAVYRVAWRPHMKRLGLEPNPRAWHSESPDVYEDWRAKHGDSRDKYPWIPWGDYYERQIVPYLKSSGVNGKR